MWRRSAIALSAVGMAVAGIACQSASTKAPVPEATGALPQKAQDANCAPGLAIASDAPVARVGEEVITCAELYEVNRGAVLRAEAKFGESVHEIHQSSLQDLIDRRLLEAEAEKAGLSVDDYVAANVKVEPATEEEMRKLYDAAVAGGQALPPFEEVTSEIQEFIRQQKLKEQVFQLRDRLRANADIKVMLPPYLPAKIDVEAIGPSKGPEGAAVTIVEFSDFECPYCQRAEPTMKRILDTYGDKVRFVYRDYPLPSHSNAPKASEAALCAQDQGKYWEMHAVLFENQHALELDDLKGYAAQLELDSDAFGKCLDSGEKAAQVAASVAAGERAGVTGTPAFFINGRMLSGALPFERFREIIEHELEQTRVD